MIPAITCTLTTPATRPWPTPSTSTCCCHRGGSRLAWERPKEKTWGVSQLRHPPSGLTNGGDMSGPTLDETAAAAVTSGVGAAAAALPAADSPTGWWQAWRTRFGLAEVCGTAAAAAGFAAGYLQAGSLLAAAALATVCEA